MKKGFSLLELIFAIVVIGIIASFAIPKYMDTRDEALASTIHRDLATATTSIQSYYLVKREINSIEDAVQINTNNWALSNNNLTMTFKEDSVDCAVLSVTDDKKISITITESTSGACGALNDLGVTTQSIDLI